jgi:hypothetical protein
MCLLACSILVSACKKDEEKPATSTSSESVVEDNNRGMTESDGVLAMSEAEMSASESRTGRISAEQDISYTNTHGATVTITPKGINPSGTILIDFGTTGIKSVVDGRTRKGKIQIVYTGRYREVGSIHTLTLDNYYIDGIKVEGTKVLTHTNDNNALITSINETGGKVTFTDGKTIEWNSERTRKWDTHNTFFDLTDDLVTVAGTATGKSREGVNFTTVIQNTSPLVWKVSCLSVSNYVAVSGILKITPATGPEYTVDYGDGNCNKDVTVSAGGISKTITLNK